MELKYKIGTKFKEVTKKDLMTIIDIWITKNSKDEIISVEYICEYDYMGFKSKCNMSHILISKGEVIYIA